MRTKNKTSVALACFLLAAFSLCDAKESSDPTLSATPSPYPILDSGVWADAIHSAEIYWLDNERILFKGSEETEKTKHYTGKFNISIWELGKGIKKYTKNVKPSLCYNSDGIIYYELSEADAQGNGQYLYGKFGKENTYKKTKDLKYYWDQMNCKLTERETVIKQRKGSAIRPLLDRHGYLNLGPVRGYATSKEFIKLYRPSDQQGISLPIQAQSLSHVYYYEFKKAYLINNSKVSKRFWWLYPDGKVEEVSASFGAGLPTRQGMVLGTGKAKSDYDPGTVGMYLVSDGKFIRLIAGYAIDVTVSPDGCKLAFVHYPYLKATSLKDSGRVTLKMINVCSEEKNHGQ